MDALAYTKDLVEFESTSYLSNAAVSDYVEDALKALGCRTERVEYDDAQGVRKVNVIGRKGQGAGGMAYFAHTDVVPADPWFTEEHGPFTPTVKGERLYGRGSCDMKGSIGCMLAAVARFSPEELRRPVYVTCTADEEVGYTGARNVVERSRFYREAVENDSNAIVGEPTRLEVIYAHKGTYGFTATARGRAAHSSTSEGVNANLAMIPFLVEMKKIHDELLEDPAWRSDEFDPPIVSWNIGINDHTRAVNITPPQSVCTVYFRCMPGQNAEALLDRARAAAEACGVELEVRMKGQPLYVDPSSEFVREVLELAGRDTPRTVSYGTDGAMFTEMKKIVVFGPGDIAQAHTHDEWIALQELERGTEVYTKLIRHWCC